MKTRSIWKGFIVLFGLILPTGCRAANPGSGGPCDSPYPDAEGNMTIVCHGLNDKQLRLLVPVSALSNRILQSGIEADRLESESGGILKNLVAAPEIKAPAGEVPLPSAGTSVPQSSPAAPPKAQADVITYDYRGFKTSSLHGPLFAENEASVVYQDLLTLQKKEEWKKLLKTAVHEVKVAPAWLTPYAFKAVALHHLGRDPEAITALEYVNERSVGNPEYDQARKLLKQLKPVP